LSSMSTTEIITKLTGLANRWWGSPYLDLRDLIR
jgi:hypothetical protein